MTISVMISNMKNAKRNEMRMKEVCGMACGGEKKRKEEACGVKAEKKKKAKKRPEENEENREK